jgi:hypothetical protein
MARFGTGRHVPYELHELRAERVARMAVRVSGSQLGRKVATEQQRRCCQCAAEQEHDTHDSGRARRHAQRPA